MKEKLFQSIFNNAAQAIADSGRMGFESRLKNANPSSYYGAAATEQVRQAGAEMEASRTQRDPGMLDSYLGDLDAVTQGLSSLSGSFTNQSNRKIKSRSDLRSMRRRAIDDRQRARQRVQSLKIDRVGEDVYYIDPESGERKMLTEDSMIAQSMPSFQPTAEVMAEAEAYYDQRFQADVESRFEANLAQRTAEVEALRGQGNMAAYNYSRQVEQGMIEADGRYDINESLIRARSQQAVRDEYIGVKDPTTQYRQSAGEIASYQNFGDTAFQQAKKGFAQLAASAAGSTASAMQGELSLRKQAAASELEARKKANKTVSESERKRYQQVQDIDKSIQSINQTFAKADAKFLSSITDGVDGVNFRADRPQ